MLLAVIVFVSVFLVAVLLSAASGVGSSEQVKRALARLEAVLVTEGKVKDELVNVEKQELLSAIPVLNRILLRLEIAPTLRRLLYQANLKWTPGGLLLFSITAWAVSSYAFALRTGSGVFGALLGLLPGALPIGFVLYQRSRRFAKFEAGLPAALDLMVAGLRGGHSLVSVLGLVAREAGDPIGPEFRICFDEQNYGLELRTALDNLTTRVPIQDIRILVTAILIQKETGGNLAEVLDKCAHVIRERFRLKREIKTRTAQGRLTGWILTLLPVGLGVLLYLLNPAVMSLLWKRPLGLKMMRIAIVLMSIGAYAIRKIVSVRV